MFDNYTYLYVEDDPLSREIMQMMMQQVMGITGLTIFEDSRDFAGRIRKVNPRPQVFLLDIHVPPMNGLQMLDFLRQEPGYEDSIIIALTASVANDEIEELQKRGFNSAIGKPISVQSFPTLMARILAGETIWHIAE